MVDLDDGRLAYSLTRLAELVDLSVDQIQKHIARGDLVPSYSGTKPLIAREEAIRWLRSMPEFPDHDLWRVRTRRD